MKSKKAFTLVELIVVITILAILWTIAFISLQSYSQRAKNSKVASDIRTLISAVEASSTQNSSYGISNLVIGTGAMWNPVLSGTFSNGIDISTASYNVWWINFPFVKQSSSDFKDPEWRDYIAASIINTADGSYDYYYQVAGQTRNQSGNYDAIVKWSYLKIINSDIDGLIAGPWYPNGITENSINMSWNGIY